MMSGASPSGAYALTLTQKHIVKKSKEETVLDDAADDDDEVELELVKPQLIDGRYKILGQLGAGAMGIVYRAEDIMLERPAALKVIEPSLAKSEAALKCFLNEARSLARLRHDNVVQIYAFGSYAATCFFAMEFIDGEPLDAIMDRHLIRGELIEIDRAFEILRKIAGGLSAAHGRNIIHRDVKPGNIVIERDTGRPVLVDFGIARELESSRGPRSSLVAGTPGYMAPEQARNDKALISEKVDVYALACTAFELLTGHPVFEGDDANQVMIAHVTQAPRLISSLMPRYQQLDRVFARALAKNPSYRHESCVAFITELIAVAQKSGILTPAFFQSPSRLAIAARSLTTGPRVLILADEDGLRRAVVREATRALQNQDRGHSFGIECVSDASEVLVAFARNPANIVILDDDRAAGTSIDLAYHLRKTTAGERAKIIIITRDMLAERTTWDRLDARRIAKPLNLRTLASTLESICASL